MKPRLTILTAFAILFSAVAYPSNEVSAQDTTRQYLVEMPPVDRVIREIQGKDPADTAARQMGAFKQLRKIIEDLAWNLDHRYMTRLTPAEKQLVTLYEEAYARVWHAGPDKSVNNMHGFDIDPRFRAEILSKFFSQNFRTMFANSFERERGRLKAKEQAEEEEMKRLQGQARAQQQGTSDPGKLQARRCAESGRDPVRCVSEAVGGEIKREVIDPILGATTRKAGLRLNGIYPGRGFGIRFTHGMGEYSAIVSCADLVPDPHPYVVEIKNNQVIVRIANGSDSFALVMNPSGTLTGPGSALIHGNVIAGYARQWVEQRRVSDNSVVPGSGHYENVPILKPKTARCTVGTLTPNRERGPQSNADPGILSLLTALTGTDTDLTPGLRLVGIFEAEPGVNLEFHPDSGTVGCREATVAHKYKIGIQGGELVVNLQDPQPATFIYRPDGTLSGPGPLTVHGRKAVANNGSSNDLTYIPYTDSCTFNVLRPMTLGYQIDLSPEKLSPTPKQSAGPANAVLSISSGFQESGPDAALKGHTVILLKDSFENILWNAGLIPPNSTRGFPAVAVWAASCETKAPLCLQGGREASKNKAAALVLDNNGQGSFAPVPPGTYYVLTQIWADRQHLLWNYRIDLKPGQNTLTLSATNATLK